MRILTESEYRIITRRGLDRALATLGSGDTLVVWKLDRLDRSLSHLVDLVAEIERSLIVERTQAGIQAAKQRGVHLGRPNRLEPSQVEHARTLVEGGESPRSSGGIPWLKRAFPSLPQRLPERVSAPGLPEAVSVE